MRAIGKAAIRTGIILLARSVVGLLPGRVVALIAENISFVRRMDYEEQTILLSIKSRWEYFSRLHSCVKEPETVRWIEEFVREGDVLYDIGANVGAYSLVAAKTTKGKAMVYAFEPAFPNFAQLCRNISLNRCEETIVPLPLALSDKTTLDTFNYNNLIPGGSFHALGDPVDFKGQPFVPVFQLRAVSYQLDDFISQFAIDAPNHIKIDVDGIEGAVLRGARRTLSNPSLKTMLVEAEPDREETTQLIESLEATGFQVHSKHEHSHVEKSGQTFRTYNYIFVRKT
jgi:FkbM family methyltransferase